MELPFQNLWTNGEWFTVHPEKVAGRTEMRSTRFDGHQPFTIGTIEDVKEVLLFSELPAIQPWHAAPGIESVPEKAESEDKMKLALRKTEATKTAMRSIIPGADPVLLSFDTVMELYSPKLSDAELRLYVQYMLGHGFDRETVSHPSNGWSRYMQPLSERELYQLCDQFKAGYNGREWIPGGLFYSGSVYLKAEELNERSKNIIVAIGQARFDAQVQHMEDAAPDKLRIIAPEDNRLFLSPISIFCSKHTIQDLVDETLSSPQSLKDVFSTWVGKLSTKDFKHGSSAYDVRYHFIEHKNFENDTEESEKAKRKRKAYEDGMKLFVRFLQDAITPREQSVIESIWNREYNGWREIPSHAVPVAFPINTRFGIGLIEPRPIVWEGVRFQRAQKSSICAFDVGVGKTMEAILVMGDALYTGGCKRPLVVVPDPTYTKWITETVGRFDKQGNEIVAGVLPHYRNKINDYKNLAANYKDKPRTHPVKDGTITFITYHGLLQMALSENEIKNALDEIIEKLDNGSSGNAAAKANESIRTTYFEKLVKGGFNFDELGFDMLIIDEAHRCKNLFESVKEQQDEDGKSDKKRYDMSGSASIIALKAFAFARFIQKRNGGRNVQYLTATPFTNSPLEIYSMLAQIGMDKLEERKMGNAPVFFDQFVNETIELSVKPTGGIKEKTVIKSFQNRVVLQSFIYGSIIFKTGEEAKVPRPKKIVLPYMKDADGVPLPLEKQVLTALPASDLQREWLNRIEEFAEETRNPGKTYIGRQIPEEYYERLKLPAQALLAINMAQAITLSPYLLNVSTGKAPDTIDKYTGKKKKGKRLGTRFLIEERPTAVQYVETSPKLNYVMKCIATVKKWHEDRNESVSGQVIYMNLGADYFPLLRDYLIDKIGYRPSEIAIIAGGMDADKKEKIKADFNDGAIKIIIGSASIREGIDLQKRSTVLYNCMLDYNPTDIVQLEGRIWRQNNKFSHVRIVVPLVENSIDPFMFQLLEEKTSRINDIWARANRSNVLNIDSFDPEELKRGLMTNPKSIATVTRDQQLNKLIPELAIATSFLDDLQNAKITIKDYDTNIEWLRGVMPRSERIMRKEMEIEEEAMKEETAPSKKEPIAKRIARYQVLVTDVQKDPSDIKAKYRLLKSANNIIISARNYYTYSEASDRLTSSKAMEEIRMLDTMIKQEKSLNALQVGILSRAGLSFSDDLTPLIAEYAQQVGYYGQEITKVKSDEWLKVETEKAQKELDERAERSQSLATRVKQFESMNHLLGCYMYDKQGNRIESGCTVDGAPEVPVALTKDIELLRKRAKAFAFAQAQRLRLMDLDIAA